MALTYDGELWESELLDVQIHPVLIVMREQASFAANWRHDIPRHPFFLSHTEDIPGWADANCPCNEQFFVRSIPALTLWSSSGATSIVDLGINGAFENLDTRRFYKLLRIEAALSAIFTALQPQSSYWRHSRPEQDQIIAHRNFWEIPYGQPTVYRGRNALGYWHDDFGVCLSEEYTEYDHSMLLKIRAAFRRRNSVELRTNAAERIAHMWDSRQLTVREKPRPEQGLKLGGRSFVRRFHRWFPGGAS